LSGFRRTNRQTNRLTNATVASAVVVVGATFTHLAR